MGIFEKLLYMHGLQTHRQRVKSFYKRVLRNLQSYCVDRVLYRYHAVLMRARFEENRKITNFQQAKELLKAGEEELFYRGHYHVVQFPASAGGSAWERDVIGPDWMLDFWHPLEKAQYPEYFCTRECRKEEYVKFWEDHIGKEEQVDLKELLKRSKQGRPRVC